MNNSKNDKLKYIDYSIVFQEVPNEVSLAITISGCKHNCKNCHSSYMRTYEGFYLSDDIDFLIDKYKNYITCVCFMGGDQNQEELLKVIINIKNKYHLKICLYTGLNNKDDINCKLLNNLNYLKIGSYVEELGALDSRITNQRFYQIDRIIDCNNKYVDKIRDITHLFWKN